MDHVLESFLNHRLRCIQVNMVGSFAIACEESEVASNPRQIKVDPKDDFSRLAHGIGRLGATRSAAKHSWSDQLSGVESLRRIS